MVDKELAEALLKAVPKAERIVQYGMCLFVLCEQSDVDITPYLHGIDTGDYTVCAVKTRTSFADEIMNKGEVVV